MSLQIQSGDTLSAIASRFGTSVAALARANGIENVNLILAGDTLKIPGDAASVSGGGRSSALTLPGDAASFSGGGSHADVLSGQYNGQGGMQCLEFVQYHSTIRGGIGYAKNAWLDGNHPGYEKSSTPQPGDIFVTNNGEYGHIGFVKDVNPDGSITVVDSNWVSHEQVGEHTISAAYLDQYLLGYLRKA